MTFILLVLFVVGKMFTLGKMGEKKWTGIIPVYSEYLLFKHCWNTKMFTVFIAVVAGIYVAIIVGGMLPDSSFTQFSLSLILSIATSLLGLVCSIASIVLLIMLYNRLARCFGHEAGYTIGLLLLAPVFFLALGLNNDQFIPIA